KQLCEQVAVHCALALQRGEPEVARASLVSISLRNPDILSVALRDKVGKLLTQVGDHLPWDPDAALSAPATQMQVPIAVDGKLWGHAEYRFRAPDGPAAWWPVRNTALLLLVFVAA